MKQISTLLIQIRENEAIKKQEYECFLKYSELNRSEMSSFDVFKTPQFDETILKGFDMVFIGGASEASVLDPASYPFVPCLIEVLKTCITQNIPTFASCFGFQAAVLALEGSIFKDPDEIEMGTYPISLSNSALNDPVFKNCPNPFMAITVHQEMATELPSNCELLAYTQKCAHAFKVKDKPFYAFQFHPEVDKETLIHRLGVYQSKYTDGPDHFQSIIENAVETPESNGLVKVFVDYYRSKLSS